MVGQFTSKRYTIFAVDLLNKADNISNCDRTWQNQASTHIQFYNLNGS